MSIEIYIEQDWFARFTIEMGMVEYALVGRQAR